MTESIDPAIPLDTNESVEWSGRPRITTILPAVVIGVLLLVSGIVVSVTRETLLFLAVVPLPEWRSRLEVFRSARRAVRDNGRGTLRETRRVDPVCHTGKPRNRPEQLLWAGYHGIDLRIRPQLRSKSLVGTTSRSGRSRTLVQSGHSSIEQHRTTMVSVGTVDGNPVSLEICRSGSKFVTDPSDSQLSRRVVVREQPEGRWCTHSAIDLLPRLKTRESHHGISGRAWPYGFKTHTFQASLAW